MQKIKKLFYLVLLTPVWLTACNSLPVSGQNEPVSAVVDDSDGQTAVVTEKQPVITDDAVTASAPSEDSKQADDASVPKIDLDGETLFSLLAAEFAGNAGDIETSLKYYHEAAGKINDSRIAARTAYIALYGKNYDEALSALDRWQQLEPDATDLPRMYAVTYLRLGQPEKAVPAINKMLTDAHESSSEEAVAVKHLLAKEASTEDAYIVLQKLNSPDSGRKPTNKHLLILQSRYAAELKHYDEATALLDQVLQIDPELFEVLIIKARIFIAQGKNREATDLIKTVLDEYPDNTALRLQYARMLVEQQQLPDAVEQYEALYETLPDDGDIALSLALLYIETQRLDDSVAVLQHLIDIDKKTTIANYYLGRIAQNQRDEKQAIAYFLRVSNGEYYFDAQLRVGILLSVLGKPDEGLKKLEALAESQHSWSLRVKAYLAQGEILRNEHRYSEGVEMYSRALQYKQDDTNLLYARGLMAEKVDRLDMTESDLLKVISREPENANALNALGYTLADRTTRYEEALDYIKRAAELVPDDPAILDSLGWVSYRLGRMDEAIKWLSQAFAKMVDAEIAAHYGEVLWHANQKEQAREIWKKGRAQNAENPVLVETLERIKPW